jgi:hypothetical protein
VEGVQQRGLAWKQIGDLGGQGNFRHPFLDPISEDEYSDLLYASYLCKFRVRPEMTSGADGMRKFSQQQAEVCGVSLKCAIDGGRWAAGGAHSVARKLAAWVSLASLA